MKESILWLRESSLDKLPQVRPGAVSVGPGEDKFANEKISGCGVRKQWDHRASVARCSYLLGAVARRYLVLYELFFFSNIYCQTVLSRTAMLIIKPVT